MEKLVDKIRIFKEEHRMLVYLMIGAILIGGMWWWQGRQPSAGQTVASESSFPSSSSTSGGTTEAKTGKETGKVWVDVKGAVNKPGVYHLKKWARVQEAIEVAGMQTTSADLNQVNLAKELQDQQVVYVPVKGERVAEVAGQVTTAATETSTGFASSQGETVNLNTATKEQLQTIDGIGDKKADKIIAYRQEHGAFKTVEDLKNVDGFGDKTVAKIKDRLAV